MLSFNFVFKPTNTPRRSRNLAALLALTLSGSIAACSQQPAKEQESATGSEPAESGTSPSTDSSSDKGEPGDDGETTGGSDPEGENSEGENPDGEKPEDENPDGEKPDGEKPEDENPDGEKPEDENPDGEKPEDENPDGEKPEEENPDGEKPEDENPEGKNPDDEKPAPKDELQVVISVDWEGFSLDKTNIDAMASFRADYPEVPLTQFLNPAYYTKNGANAASINAAVQRTLLKSDELGLHIHGWRSLFVASGVTFRDNPLFWSPILEDKVGDAGHNVDIGSYTAAQLRKVIAYSLNTLEKQGYGRAESFRSGGWMSRAPVIDALIAEGVLRDSSAVATKHFLDDDWVNKNLFRWLSQELWGDIKFDSQPYMMKGATGEILQIPDNGALADYVKGTEMVDVYEACKAKKASAPDKHVTMNFGFHQETAQRFLPRLRDGLARIEAAAKKDGLKIVYRTTKTMQVSL